MKKRTKNLLRALVGIFVAILAIGAMLWLISGRSPQAIIVSHSLTQATMEDYELYKGDKTDKSTVEIPDNVSFPREVRQYRVGNMQVFHMEALDDSKPIVLYIHGGAYFHNFCSRHFKAMAKWAKKTGCGIVAVAAAFGALPSPASFENRPRFTPCITAIPTAPPAACSHPKALRTMRLSIAGICVKFAMRM